MRLRIIETTQVEGGKIEHKVLDDDTNQSFTIARSVNNEWRVISSSDGHNIGDVFPLIKCVIAELNQKKVAGGSDETKAADFE